MGLLGFVTPMGCKGSARPSRPIRLEIIPIVSSLSYCPGQRLSSSLCSSFIVITIISIPDAVVEEMAVQSSQKPLEGFNDPIPPEELNITFI